jgi:hypothetical protein
MLSVPISQAGLSDLRGAAEQLPPVAQSVREVVVLLSEGVAYTTLPR